MRAPVAQRPLVVGAAAGGALAAASLTLTVALGWGGSPLDLAFWGSLRGWFDALFAALFGWAVGSGTAIVEGGRRDLAELRPALRAGAEPEELDPLPRRVHVVVVLGAVALGLAINLSPGNWLEERPAPSDPFFLWTTLRTVLVAWALLRATVIAARFAMRLSQLGPALRVDDLLDLRPFAPLGRNGLRNLAVWVGFCALFAAMLIAPFGRSVAASNLLVSLVVGIGAFLAPVHGAHRRLRAARDGELARVRAALSARLRASRSDDDLPTLSVADLLAWEQRIEHVRTWPFDAPTMLRFALYVAIGLGSWVGAALVERALGAALG
jgi:hypothetical protein